MGNVGANGGVRAQAGRGWGSQGLGSEHPPMAAIVTQAWGRMSPLHVFRLVFDPRCERSLFTMMPGSSWHRSTRCRSQRIARRRATCLTRRRPLSSTDPVRSKICSRPSDFAALRADQTQLLWDRSR